MRHRFRSRTSPARLLSLALQICMQYASTFLQWPSPGGRPQRRGTSGFATSPSGLEARGSTTICEHQSQHCVAARFGRRSWPPPDPGGRVAFRILVRRQRVSAQAIEDEAESRPSPNVGFAFGLGGHCAGSGHQWHEHIGRDHHNPRSTSRTCRRPVPGY